MNYKVIEASYSLDLQEKVEKYLEGGWKPQGGIHVYCLGIRDRYFQALIKE